MLVVRSKNIDDIVKLFAKLFIMQSGVTHFIPIGHRWQRPSQFALDCHSQAITFVTDVQCHSPCILADLIGALKLRCVAALRHFWGQS